MSVYKDILEELDNNVRIIDAPRSYSRNEVEKLIEIALLEKKIEYLNLVPTFNDSLVESLKNELIEKTKNYFGYRIV